MLRLNPRRFRAMLCQRFSGGVELGVRAAQGCRRGGGVVAAVSQRHSVVLLLLSNGFYHVDARALSDAFLASRARPRCAREC